MKDCPLSTNEEKDSLLKEFYKARSEKGRLSVLSQTQEACHALQGSGRYFAKLADSVDVIVNGDYGADHSALSEQHVKQCANAGVFVKTLTLREPIRMSLALGANAEEDSQVYCSNTKVRVSVTLNTPEGPLRLRNLEFLVFKEFMPEILIARPVLQAIGFNLDEHLKRVRNQFHDADFSISGFLQHFPPKRRFLQKLLDVCHEFYFAVLLCLTPIPRTPLFRRRAVRGLLRMTVPLTVTRKTIPLMSLQFFMATFKMMAQSPEILTFFSASIKSQTRIHN